MTRKRPISISGSTTAEIVASVRQLIDQQLLSAGEPLPAVRSLATELGVNRNTVAAAYQRLALTGLVESDRQGTRVTRREARTAFTALGEPTYGPDVHDLSFSNPDPELLPDLAPFLPTKLGQRPHLYGAAAELPELLALATTARDRQDAQPSIVHGTIDGLERVLMAHLVPGDRVAVEEPCFTRFIILLRMLGLVPIGVCMDDEGMLPDALEGALAQGVRAVIMTPAAQNPTGATLTSSRARALAKKLKAHPSVLLVEDDHFWRLTTKPSSSVVSLSHSSRQWAVLRSLSKCLGPDLRLGFLLSDPVTSARVRDRQAAGVQWVSTLLQRTAASALQSELVKRKLDEAAIIYARRRETLLQALTRRGVDAHGREGLNVWLPLQRGESQVAQFLLANGWATRTGELFRLERPTGGIRITTALLECKDAEKLADIVAAALTPNWQR